MTAHNEANGSDPANSEPIGSAIIACVWKLLTFYPGYQFKTDAPIYPQMSSPNTVLIALTWLRPAVRM